MPLFLTCAEPGERHKATVGDSTLPPAATPHHDDRLGEVGVGASNSIGVKPARTDDGRSNADEVQMRKRAAREVARTAERYGYAVRQMAELALLLDQYVERDRESSRCDDAL